MGIFGSIGKALNPMNAPGMKQISGAMSKAPGMQAMGNALPGAMRKVIPGMQKPGIGPSMNKGMMGQNMGMKPPMGQQAPPTPDWGQMSPDVTGGGMNGGEVMQPQVQPMNPQQGQGNAFGVGMRPQIGPSMGGIQGLMAKAKMMQGRR